MDLAAFTVTVQVAPEAGSQPLHPAKTEPKFARAVMAVQESLPLPDGS
jgi:hypothetical protein